MITPSLKIGKCSRWLIRGLSLALALPILGRLVHPIRAPGGARPPSTRRTGGMIAISLKQAERELRNSGPRRGEVPGLGGIGRITGGVFDADRQDLILVGEARTGARGDGMDDLVVALRSLFLHKTWPAVSIDKTAETRRTKLQTVRLEGALEDTGFGDKLLRADITLKKLALGLLPCDGWPGRSYFDLSADRVRRLGREEKVGCRFWFYPVHPALALREDTFALRNVQVGVLTEVFSSDGRSVTGAGVRDAPGDDFSHSLSENIRAVGGRYPEVGRLDDLLSLVAVAKGIQSLSARPDLRYWLREYPVARHGTARTYPLLARREPMAVSGRHLSMQIDGGVELRALSLRLRDGDLLALKELVLKSRPRGDALFWTVPLEARRESGSPKLQQVEPGEATASGRLGATLDREVLPAGSRRPVSSEEGAPRISLREPKVIVTDGLSGELPVESSPGSYYSLDGGKTYIRKEDNGFLPFNQGEHFSPDGGKTNFLKVDPKNSTGGGEFVSPDGGKTVFQKVDGVHLSSDGIYYSTDGGATNHLIKGELRPRGSASDDARTSPFSPAAGGSAPPSPGSDPSPRGGVLIAPDPIRVGRMNGRERLKILRSRPATHRLTWGVKLPVKGR